MASKTARKAAGTVSVIGATIGASFIDFMRDTLALISHRVREDVDTVMDQVEHRLVVLQKRLMNQALAYAVLALGGIFLVVAAYFFLTSTFGVPKEYVFLGLAVVLIIIGLIFKNRAEGV